MAQPTVNGTIWQLTIEYQQSGQTLLNTFHYLQGGGVADYPTFVAQWDTLLLSAGNLFDLLTPCLTQRTAITAAIYQPIRPDRYRLVRVPHTLSGTQEDDPPPQNVAQVVTRAGVLANRRNLGSIHLPPPPNTEIAAGQLSAAQINRLTTFATWSKLVLAPGGGGTTLSPVLVSRDPASLPQPITVAFAQSTTRVMRRRTVGLGI